MLTIEEMARLQKVKEAMMRGEKWLEHIDEDDVVWIKVVGEWLKC